MNKTIVKVFSSCILFGIIWFITLVISSLLIKNFTAYSVKTILFVEGIMFIFFGVLSSIYGNFTGLSMNDLYKNDYQYISNAVLETRVLDKKTIMEINIKTSLSMISLIVGGLLSIFINFII